MRKTSIILVLALLLGLVSLPAQAAWRSDATSFTVYYCGQPARMERVREVLRWHASGYHIIWLVTLETAFEPMLVANSTACNSDGRTEAMWTMDKSTGQALIIPYLEGRGVDTSAMTAAQLANAFTVEFKADLIQWEAEYNASLAEQAAPAPAAVDPLEEP